MIGLVQWRGKIMHVSLHLLYLIFDRLLNWLRLTRERRLNGRPPLELAHARLIRVRPSLLLDARVILSAVGPLHSRGGSPSRP